MSTRTWTVTMDVQQTQRVEVQASDVHEAGRLATAELVSRGYNEHDLSVYDVEEAEVG